MTVFDLTVSKQGWINHISAFNEGILGYELAVLFRANAELFRAFGKIKNSGLNDFEIHIQTSNDNFIRTREVSHLIDRWNTQREVSLNHTELSNCK